MRDVSKQNIYVSKTIARKCALATMLSMCELNFNEESISL